MLFGKRKRVVNRILIVEDEPLTAFDNEVMREPIDLILSDYRLSSRRTGLDLARAAKNRGIPIVFSTGHKLPKESMHLALGCIHKPYSERTLKLALEAVDKRLAGKHPKPPKGLELFVPEGG